MNHKPLNLAAAKNFFSSMYVIGTTCFNECFLFHVINFIITLILFFNHHAIGFFETEGNPIQ